MARRLRDAVAAEDRVVGELTGELTDRIRARKKPIPRRETLTGVADEWRRRMPPRGQLAIEIDLNARRKSLRIREMRATTSVYRPEEWDVAEKGMIVGLTLLEVWPLHSKFDLYTLAHVGLHAIGRRFQRGVDTSEAAIMHDLHALALAHHRLADQPSGSEFRVSLDHGGVWRGSVELVHDPRVGYDKSLTVRTYLVDGA
jgi:hypothetical protein